MKSRELEKYLVELGEDLEKQGIIEPIRVLMIGGAYMILLTKMRNRTTDDIDVLFLDQDRIPNLILLNTVQAIATKHQETLNDKWLNANAANFLPIYGPIPHGQFWRNYGPLQIYIPNAEYILALKLISTRQKDLTDAKYLCKFLGITRKQQKYTIMYTYIENPDELSEISDWKGNIDRLGLH